MDVIFYFLVPIEKEVSLSVKITDEESKSEKKSKHVEFDLSNLDTPHDDQDNKDAKKETTEIFSVNASPELKGNRSIYLLVLNQLYVTLHVLC